MPTLVYIYVCIYSPKEHSKQLKTFQVLKSPMPLKANEVIVGHACTQHILNVFFNFHKLVYLIIMLQINNLSILATINCKREI